MKRRKLSDQIADQLEGMIADGTLQPGARLPAERQLAERLSVSRPSLREAIQKLASKGLLSARQGGGTYVAKSLVHSFTDPLLALLKDRPDVEFDTLEVRKELEGVAAFNAATRATDADRKRILTRFDEMAERHRSNASSIDKLHVDVAFHQSIVDAGHNIVLVHFTHAIHELLENTVNKYLDRLYGEPAFVDKLCNQHQDIVSAIMDRDPEAAREQARNHLEFALQAFREFQSQARLSCNAELYAAMFQED